MSTAPKSPGDSMHLARAELVKKNFSHFEIDKAMDVIVSLGWRPATPAPESPASAPTIFHGADGEGLTLCGLEVESVAISNQYDCPDCKRGTYIPGSDIGTGSETSPDAARQEDCIIFCQLHKACFLAPGHTGECAADVTPVAKPAASAEQSPSEVSQ